MTGEGDFFFDGLGFERRENKWGVYYKAPSGGCYRIDHFDHTYVIEFAESEADADNSLYEDGDLFDDDMSKDRLIHEIQLSIKKDEGDSDRLVSIEELKKLLYVADIEGLCRFPMNAPEDEYDSEAEHIMEVLKKKDHPGRYEIESILCDEFDRSFGIEHDREEFFELSYAIKTGNTHPCPVCKKIYFYGDEYDICPVCGWEDDRVQYNDLSYAGGANHLSAKQAGLEYYMLSHKKLSDEAKRLKEEFDERYKRAFSEYMKGQKAENKDALNSCISDYIRDLILLHMSDCETTGDCDMIFESYYEEVMS